MTTDNNKPAASDLSAAAGSLLAECLETLADVYDNTVNASCYPDGENLDYHIRKRIKGILEEAENH